MGYSEEESEIADTLDGMKKTRCIASAVDTYLFNGDVALLDKTDAAKAMAIVCNGIMMNASVTKNKPLVLADSLDHLTGSSFRQTYYKVGNSSTYPNQSSYTYSPVYTTLKSKSDSCTGEDNCVWCHFTQATVDNVNKQVMTTEELYSIWSSNKSTMDSCKTKFIGLWSEPGTGAKLIQEAVAVIENASSDKEVFLATAQYLDILSMVIYCIDSTASSSNIYNNVLSNYLSNLNFYPELVGDPSMVFTGIAIVPLICWGALDAGALYAYSLHSVYANLLGSNGNLTKNVFPGGGIGTGFQNAIQWQDAKEKNEKLITYESKLPVNMKSQGSPSAFTTIWRKYFENNFSSKSTP